MKSRASSNTILMSYHLTGSNVSEESVLTHWESTRFKASEPPVPTCSDLIRTDVFGSDQNRSDLIRTETLQNCRFRRVRSDQI